MWLIFSVAFLLMMLGALFFAARYAPPPSESEISPPATVRPAISEVSGSANVTVAFSLSDMEGQSRDFSEWDGEFRILNFWATWCAPCRREIPLLKAFQDQHGEAGFRVIGIAVDFVAPVIEYAETAAFNYPILVGEEDAMAVAETSGIDFIGLPFTMFVARDGELLGTHIGEIHKEQLERVAAVLTDLDRGLLDKAAATTTLNAL